MSIKINAKRKGRRAATTKLTPEIALKLIKINDKNFGKLSFKKLAWKLKEEDVSVTPMTVRAWCKVHGCG